MAGFKVNIGANAAQLTKTLGELQKDLAALKKQLSTTLDAKEVIRLNQAIAQTEKQIKNISGAQNINALNLSLKQIPPGANQATTALGNLGRVASDAPFGFIAISNNIEPMIQSFIFLKQQSGSTGAALKALGGSLIGGGGLLLAFSLVTSALTIFSQHMGSSKKELEGFSKAQADSNKEAGEEIAHLKVLAAVAANTANATKDRKSAAEQLSKVLKESNVQLSAEEALNNRAAAAIDLATQAILARARARAVENRIAELSAKNLDREIKREEATSKLTVAQKKLNEEEAKAKKGGRLLISSIEGRQAQITVGNITDEIKDLDDQTSKATDEINNLLTKVTTPPKATGGKDPIVDLLKKRIEALKKLQSEAGLSREQLIELAQLEIKLVQRDGSKSGLKSEEIKQQVDAIIKKAFPNEFLDARFKIRVIGEIDPTQTKIDKAAIPNIDVSGALGLDKIDTATLDPMIKKLQDASAAKRELLKIDEAKQFAEFITGELGPAFTELFSGILSGSSNAFQTFAKMIGDLIKRLIAAAAAALILSTILNAIFPGLGLGGLKGFKSIFGSLTGLKFAEGGVVTRPTLGLFGEAGPEAVIPLSRLPQMMGQNSSGGMHGEFTARIADGGRDLLIIMNRQNAAFNRKF